MLDKRFLSSLMLILLLLATVLWFPRPVVAVVVAVVVGTGLWEFYGLAEIKGYRPFKGWGITGGIVLSVVTYIILSYQTLMDVNEGISLVLFLIVVTVLVKYPFKKEGSSVIVDGGVTLLGILYVSFLFTFIIKLRYIPDPVIGKGWVMALFVITKISDVSAYICGTRWGRHKLIPRISANKSIEGSVLGVVAAVLASVLCKLWFLNGPGWIAIIGLGILLSGVGQIGDLIESLIKRDAQVKDSGKLVAGFGGILDVMDSLLFAGPVMYIYLKWIIL